MTVGKGRLQIDSQILYGLKLKKYLQTAYGTFLCTCKKQKRIGCEVLRLYLLDSTFWDQKESVIISFKKFLFILHTVQI